MRQVYKAKTIADAIAFVEKYPLEQLTIFVYPNIKVGFLERLFRKIFNRPAIQEIYV
jgi:hypothetical protein